MGIDLFQTFGIVTVELLRKFKVVRFFFTALGLMSLVVGSALMFFSWFGSPFGTPVSGNAIPIALLNIGLAFVFLTFVMLSYVEPERFREIAKVTSDDDVLLKWLYQFSDDEAVKARASWQRSYRRQEIGPPKQEEVVASTDADEDIIRSIRANLAQLIEYYIMNKSQAKSSFRASLWSIIAGFVAIVVGGIWAYSAERNDLTAYLIPFGGLILQFIGGGYFYMYNRSLIQLNFFFSRLAQMQDTLLAIHLTDGMAPGETKEKALERLVFVIAERSTNAPAYLAQDDFKNKAPSRT